MDAIAKEYLGSGYDLCGQYADGVSVKRKLFDLEKVPEKDIRQLANRRADFFSVVGRTVEAYQSSLSAKAGISGAYKLFTGSVEASFSSTDLSISESSFVTIDLCMRYETWKLQTTSTEYMYPGVLEDFKNKDGKWLIEEYGGGVVMGMDLGGRWIDNLAVSKLYENSTSDVEVAMEAAYGGFISGHGSSEVSKAVEKEKSIANRRVNVVGGNPAFAPGKLDDWQHSVKDAPAFMDFTSDGVVMMWDLFPQYADKLKAGFDEYVKEHQLNIRPRKIIEGTYVEGFQYASDAGSGADRDLGLYKPPTADGYSYVGVNGNSNRILVLKQASDKYGALREPTGWHPVWDDRGSGNDYDYNCWMPKGPPDFLALGVYCRFRAHGQGPPSRDEAKGLVVVHKSLVQGCNFQNDNIWSDAGTGADYDLTLGRLPDEALWPSRTTDPRAGQLPSKYAIKTEYIN